MQLTVAALVLLAHSVSAQFQMLRFACSQLVVERVDPIVNPGMPFTPHLHQIVGGNSFNLTMEPGKHDPSALSTCTSCNFKEDMSNYWTAVLFFRHNNGSFKRVPQVGNGGPQGQLVNKGGLDVYYIPSGKVTAFKPGFRMIAGDASNMDPKRVSKGNICHRCWQSTDDNKFTGGAPCTGSDTVDPPFQNGCMMIRQTIIFPTCWNGKDLDSPNHRDHMTYSGSGASGGGSCPASHPVKVPQVMYELMWNSSEFMRDRSAFPKDGSNPFIYSMANAAQGGAGAHGDYLFGWKGDSLQKAMDNNCPLNTDCKKNGVQILTAQKPDVYSACTKPQMAKEQVDGWLAKLPLGEMAVKA